MPCAAALLVLAGPFLGAHGAVGGQEDRRVRITARIQDLDTNTNLLGAVIELSGVPSRHVTGVDGRVTFDAAVGDYTLTVRRGGYSTIRGDFSVIRPGHFTLKMSRAEIDDPTAPSRLLVRVVDSQGGIPVEGATVSLRDGRRSVTDSEGRAEFRDLRLQLTQVAVEMIGYADRNEPVSLHPDRTTAVEVALTVEAVPLRPLKVEVRSRFLESHGVYRRMDQGVVMRLLTRETIQERGSIRISDAFAHVPGIRISRESTSRSVLVAPRNCALAVYVDGIPMGVDIEGSVDIDQIPPDWVELAEVYWGPRTPVEYQGIHRDGCGAVLIWTRQKSRAGSASDAG
ncbi:MAG: carboxypeptidase regulatory-like domain-containing protein [Gemmatimonadetes bacterium]|nr:carboxypeptidase regulatory-like domain-containing protein [Gemmatimonadota bacterium]